MAAMRLRCCRPLHRRSTRGRQSHLPLEFKERRDQIVLDIAPEIDGRQLAIAEARPGTHMREHRQPADGGRERAGVGELVGEGIEAI